MWEHAYEKYKTWTVEIFRHLKKRQQYSGHFGFDLFFIQVSL
jgi:hypothetical protein